MIPDVRAHVSRTHAIAIAKGQKKRAPRQMSLLWSLVLFLTPVSAHAPRWCATAEAAAVTRDQLVRVVESDGAMADQSRRVYALPRTTRDSVVLVRDERVCERAARAYYRDRLGAAPGFGVSVVRIHDRYAVYGVERAGEWSILVIYSPEFESIVRIAM
jgi:hypothetical protein